MFVKVENLVMEDVEERALETYHTKIPVQRRYVDDAFVAIRDPVEEFQGVGSNGS